jgi:hypothetical protein
LATLRLAFLRDTFFFAFFRETLFRVAIANLHVGLTAIEYIQESQNFQQLHDFAKKAHFAKRGLIARS